MAAGIRKRLDAIGKKLYEKYGELRCTLDYQTPHQLMVATILSAQCTDARVNKVTPALFDKYPDVQDFAKADVHELENIIRPLGFFRSKAENIIDSARRIVSEFHGQVPREMLQLTSLAGIGRKTANVILGDAFAIPGFPVDTHVKRVLKRLGITRSDNPERIESEVTAILDRSLWTNFSHMLIRHGRETCDARKPRCPVCVLSDLCPSRLTETL